MIQVTEISLSIEVTKSLKMEYSSTLSSLVGKSKTLNVEGSLPLFAKLGFSFSPNKQLLKLAQTGKMTTDTMKTIPWKKIIKEAPGTVTR